MSRRIDLSAAVYLDQDGVLADFDQGCRDQGVEPNWRDMDTPRDQMTPQQLECDDRIRLLMDTPGFFEWLNPMPDAMALWEFCSRVSPGFPILTAHPRNEASAARCAREKRAMIHRVFGPISDDRFICCLAAQKKTYVGYKPGALQILVDDRPSNCNQWVAAGGHAVLHHSAERSILLMKAVMGPMAVADVVPI